MHGRRGQARGESIQQWRAYAHKTGCARALLFYRRTSKSIQRTFGQVVDPGFMQKGEYRDSFRRGFFLSSFSLFPFGIGLGQHWQAPLTLRHLVAWLEMCFPPASGRNGAVPTSLEYTREMHFQLESPSWVWGHWSPTVNSVPGLWHYQLVMGKVGWREVNRPDGREGNLDAFFSELVHLIRQRSRDPVYRNDEKKKDYIVHNFSCVLSHKDRHFE
ncbi:hypothetical protein LZ31DRAFT_82743 [Colletotrichum somersetense]|nr:hypothetical protein LZ31DRAFT_82743 [Colletotrichum somersetense]